MKVLELPEDSVLVIFDFNKLKKDALKFNSMQVYAARAKDLHLEMSKNLDVVSKKYGLKARVKTLIIMED